MVKRAKKLAILTVAGLIIIAGVFFLVSLNNKPKNLDEFARCLGNKGASLYGAFWCSHCKSQKAMFGKSAGLLPYVECSNPDGRGQLSVCKDKGIDVYPTWLFSDGSREAGKVSLDRLAEKTGCQLSK